MPGLRDLKQRIKGIQGMRKVTRAMQMVSAAKMRKAQDAVLASRTYADLAWELVQSVIPEGRSAADGLSGIQNYGLDAGSESGMAQLMMAYPKATKVGVVLLTSNRGLVGSLNTNLQPKIKESGKNTDLITEVISYGKYAKKISGRMNKNITADFPKAERKISSEDIYPIAQFIIEAYKTGQYKQIVIVYNHFVSTLVQKASVKQLLPFAPDLTPSPSPLTPNSDYLFEPTPQAVLDHLLPRIIESQIYETILESDASEHSARMVMMKNATEAAGDLIDDYTLTYNQLRQGKITTELSEITAGRIALE